MAHYLLFIAVTGESICLWIVYIIAKWVVTRPPLTNDMSVLYRAPRATPVNDQFNVGVSRNLRAITYTAIVLSYWLMTRYEYHFSMYLLTERILNLVFVTSSLCNLLKPGTV